MAIKRETKDSLILNQGKSSSDSNQEKPKENLDNTKDKKDDNHSFYDKKPDDSKGFFKRHLKSIIAIIIILIIALGLGFGLGFGLSGKTPTRLGGIFNHFTEEQIDNFLNNRRNESLYETEHLKDNSVIWADKILIDQKISSKHDYDLALDQADNQISDEKDSYRNDYGKDWSKKWNDNLISLGFDTEDQYRNNLIATSLLSSMGDELTNDIYGSFSSSNLTGKTYRSTMQTTNDNYFALNGNYNDDSLIYFDSSLDKSVINHQFLFDFYQNIYNPISYTDVKIPLTFSSPNNDGLTSNVGSFGLTTANLPDIWIFFSDLATISNKQGEEFLDLHSPDYNSSYIINSDITNLNSSVLQNSTLPIVFFDIYSSIFDDSYSNVLFDDNVYFSSQLFNYYYMFYEEVALDYRNVYKPIYESSGTFVIDDSNKNQFFIPGYGATNDTNVWVDDALPADDTERIDSIDSTFNGIYTDDYISNLSSDTQSGNIVSRVNLNYYDKVLSTNNLYDNTDRQLFYRITIPTLNTYSYDGDSFTFYNTDTSISDPHINTTENPDDEYYITQSIDGTHLIRNNVPNHYDQISQTGESANQDLSASKSDAKMMLAYEFDKMILKNNGNSLSQVYSEDFKILENYETWLKDNLSTIIFNEYLNYVNVTYNSDGNGFTNEEKSAFVNGENIGWKLHSDPEDILYQFYNEIYWDDQQNALTSITRSDDFLDKYGSIYLDGFDVDSWDNGIFENLTYFELTQNQYQLKTLGELLNSGDLS